MQQLELQVERMSCGHCVARVTEALKKLPSVHLESVAIGRVVLSHDPQVTAEADMRAVLEDIGYPVAAVRKAA